MKLLRTMEIAADNGYMVGDTIAFTLTNGEEVEAMAVKQEQDSMIFCLVDCLNLAYYMNLEDSNRGGYAATAMRARLNGEILDRFPADIRAKMLTFANGDYLRLPTEKEIFGCNECGTAEPGNVVQWEPMKQQRNRIAFWGKGTNQWVRYWLQNAYTWKCLGKRYNSYFLTLTSTVVLTIWVFLSSVACALFSNWLTRLCQSETLMTARLPSQRILLLLFRKSKSESPSMLFSTRTNTMDGRISNLSIWMKNQAKLHGIRQWLTLKVSEKNWVSCVRCRLTKTHKKTATSDT